MNGQAESVTVERATPEQAARAHAILMLAERRRREQAR